MGKGKISKKMLKKMGLSHLEKQLVNTPIEDRITEGRNKHRLHLQTVKNDLLRQDRERGIQTNEINTFFNFRQDHQEYSSFRSLLSQKKWDELDLD
jgi:hypothetical protein